MNQLFISKLCVHLGERRDGIWFTQLLDLECWEMEEDFRFEYAQTKPKIGPKFNRVCSATSWVW
jgi:hypothetical protein